jgi:hypothetical protein
MKTDERLETLSGILRVIQENCEITLTKYQLDAATAIFRAYLSDENLEEDMLWARRSGKTECLALAGIAIGIYELIINESNFLLGLVNPAKTNQSVMVTRKRMQERLEQLKPFLGTLGITMTLGRGQKTGEIYLHHKSNNTRFDIRAISADPSANEKGEGFNLMFLEQVEDMDETTMKTIIFPMAAGANLKCTMVLAGTPALSIENEYFYKKTRDLKYPFLIDGETAARERPAYNRLLTAAKEQLGEDSEEFQTQYACKWVQLRNRLVDRETLEKLAEDYTPDPARYRVAGIDVAKQVDRTVVTIAEEDRSKEPRQIHILDWLEREGVDYEDQAEDIIQCLSYWKVKAAVIEKNGPGNVVIDVIRKRHPLRIIPFDSNSRSCDELYTDYKREIDQGRLHYPKTPTEDQRRALKHFTEEHLDAIREANYNLIKVHAPDRRDAHDDYVSSGALAVHGILKGDNSGLFMLMGARNRWIHPD